MVRISNPRFSLNVYKLRDGITGLTVLVDIAGFPYSAEISVGEGRVATLYYGTSNGKPDWLQKLSLSAVSPLEDLRSSSVSGILIVQIDQRNFVLTFGHAWQRVRHAVIEPNFGIRCVLNLAKIDSLRAIRRDRVAEAFIQAIEQIPDSDDISRFGMDIEKDLLRGVKARIDEKLNFGAWVAGADSFKASIDLEVESIAVYLSRCLTLWSGDGYKNDFEWVDNISPIRDAALEEQLTIELAKQVAAKNPGLTLCIPDILEWDDHDIFSFERKRARQSPCANHLDLGHWVEFITAEVGDITPELLEGRSIYAYKIDGAPGGRWPVKQCVHGLISMDGRSYLAHGGDWFEISGDFVRRTNEKIDAIPLATITLPCANLCEKEDEYSLRVSNDSGGTILHMDKKLIHHGGGKSRFEVCDLFTEDGHIVCIKSWGGKSGDLSHLFQQARNSITLINNDPTYRTKVRSYIEGVDSKFKLSWDYICDEPKVAEVVLAALRGCPKQSLPFFAKLSLVNCVEDLRKMRFEASYLVIESK